VSPFGPRVALERSFRTAEGSRRRPPRHLSSNREAFLFFFQFKRRVFYNLAASSRSVRDLLIVRVRRAVNARSYR